MNICQCEKQAQGMNSPVFDLVGPSGTIHCKWLDPWFGLFMKIGGDGFWRVDDFDMPNIHCENLKEAE